MSGGRCRGSLGVSNAGGQLLFPFPGWYQSESGGVNSASCNGSPSLFGCLSGCGLVRGLLGSWAGGAPDWSGIGFRGWGGGVHVGLRSGV